MKSTALKQIALLLLALAVPFVSAADDSALDKAGRGIKKGGNAAGRGIEKGADAAGKGIKKGAEATGKGVKKGGDWIGKKLDKVFK
jgi:hypothetical protein